MSDQVSMVWVLRNRRTRKALQWMAPFVQNEPTIYIWTDKHSALEFLKLLDRESKYEACFVLLDVVMGTSKRIRVNPELRPDIVEYVQRDIDLMQEDVPSQEER